MVEVADLEPTVEFGFISKPNRVGIVEFTDEVFSKKQTIQFEFLKLSKNFRRHEINKSTASQRAQRKLKTKKLKALEDKID